MLSFTHPFILLFVPIFLLAWYIFFRERFGYTPPNDILPKYLRLPISFLFLWGLRFFILLSIGAILSRPIYEDTVVRSVPIPQDIVLVVDVSLSMLAEDITPSRIEIAKKVLREFISERQWDRISIILFAGKPFVFAPFSTDVAWLTSIIQGVSPYLIRQDIDGLSGTNIGDALILAGMQFSGSTSSTHSIILITDGKANIGVDPLISASDIQRGAIPIYTVGIGSTGGVDLFYTDVSGKKTYFYDADGKPLKSDLDVVVLQEVSHTTGGQYYSASGSRALSEVFDAIQKRIPHKMEQKIEYIKMDLVPMVLLATILLILSERYFLYFLLKRYHIIPR